MASILSVAGVERNQITCVFYLYHNFSTKTRSFYYQGEPINKLKERIKEKIDIQEKEFEKVIYFVPTNTS